MSMLLPVMREVRNFFEAGTAELKDGMAVFGGGHITHVLLPGRGVVYPVTPAGDGVFEVEDCADLEERVYALRVPCDFLGLVGEIESFQARPGANSGIIKESVMSGAHSYTLAAGKDGSPLSWQSVFRGRLNPFRRMFY